MKQLLEFENWASDIVHNSIFEKKDDTIKREIPKQQDIVFQAQRKYPDRDADQALSLFLADKLEDFDKRDLQQNQVINAQRRENEKLRTNFTALQQELDDIETGSAQTDAEVKRLKQLSGQLKTDVETRRVSSDEIRDVLAQVEQLKNKPGMDPKQYEQLKQQVEDFKSTRVDPQKFDEFSKKIDAMSSQERISSDNLREIQKAIADLEAKQIAGTELKGSLEQKIQNLSKEQEAATQVIQQQVQDLANQQEKLGAQTIDIENAKELLNKLNAQSNSLEAEKEEIRNTLSDIEQRERALDAKTKEAAQAWRQDPKAQAYRKAVGKRSKQASALIKNFLQKDFPEIKQEIDDKIKSVKNLASETEWVHDFAGDIADVGLIRYDLDDIKKEIEKHSDAIQSMHDSYNALTGAGQDIDFVPIWTKKEKERQAWGQDPEIDEIVRNYDPREYQRNLEKWARGGAEYDPTKHYRHEYTRDMTKALHDKVDNDNKVDNKNSNNLKETRIVSLNEDDFNRLGKFTVQQWAVLYNDKLWEYNNEMDEYDKERFGPALLSVPELVDSFWENLLTQEQRKQFYKIANNDITKLMKHLHGLCFFISYNFKSRSLQQLKARTTTWIDYLVKSIEADKNEYYPSYEPSRFDDDDVEEAANKMVDNIIGEQVARWIK